MRLPSAVLLFILTLAPAGILPAADNELTVDEQKEGYRLLFNGKDLDSFQPDPKRGYHKWKVLDESIYLTPVDYQIDLSYTQWILRTKEEFGDYVLKVDFKTAANPESGHSAVILRQGKAKSYEPCAIEVSIYGPARKLGHFCTGAFRYELRAPDQVAVKPAGEWNSLVCTVQEQRVTVELNGVKVNHLDLREWDKPGKRPDGGGHLVPYALKDLPAKSPIGFRDDFGIPVWFKNVKIKPLKAGE